MRAAFGLLPLLLASLAAGQAPARAELVAAQGATPAYALQLPAAPAAWLPLLLVWPEADGEQAATDAVRDLGAGAASFAVVAPALAQGTLTPAAAHALFSTLRRRVKIAQGGMHAAARGELARAAAFVLAHRHQFQSFTALGAASDADLAGLRRLHARRVAALPAADAAAQGAHFAALHAGRQAAGAAAEVARTLDDFHDAAANGDGGRYFAILPDDAVFLGTDATERWTGAQFRQAFEKPYFQRPEAWTYVALARQVRLAEGDALAWFDETLDNASYGICRGSGVLVRRGERWVLQHYDLSVPMPNDLAGAFAQRIRAHGDGLPAAPARILLVRHAEKLDDSRDPPLTAQGQARAQALARALRDVPIDLVVHSEYQRTGQTVAPLCAAKQLRAEVAPAADVNALAARLRKLPAGQTAVVCGHSNTIPELISKLGGARVTIADDVFDGLYLLTRGSDGVQVTTLRYGE